MKKISYLFLILAALISLCGCNKERIVFSASPFSCEAQIESEGIISEGLFTCESEKSMYIDFPSEKDVGGLRVQYCEGEYRYSFDDVTAVMKENAVNTPLYGLFSAVKLLLTSGAEVTEEQENVFTLSDGYGEYSYTVDKDSGKVTQIDSSYGRITFRYQ